MSRPPTARPWRPDIFDLLLVAVIMLHLLAAPYTKVEESFTVQATHDILFHGRALSKYDHHEFPGVVPRTFLGALLVAGPAHCLNQVVHGLLSLSPSLSAATAASARFQKFAALITVRIVLAAVSLSSIKCLRVATDVSFGRDVGTAIVLVTAVLQFHVPFYLSRPLPNVFAMALCNVSFAAIVLAGKNEAVALQRRQKLWEISLALLAFTTAVFRCDVLLLLCSVGAYSLVTRSVHIRPAFAYSLAGGSIGIVLSTLVDSIFWRKWVWPEGVVFVFNAIQGRSVEWGVMPFHWYWTSALPRAMGVSFPLAIISPYLERRVLPVYLPSLTFIFLYSCLGHKELRFLFPVIPSLTLCAATSFARISRNRTKPRWAPFCLTALVLSSLTLALVCVTSIASYMNYPGGWAFERLHELYENSSTVPQRLHVGVKAAMTGVSRYGEAYPAWEYSKDEGIEDSQLWNAEFDYVLSERNELQGFQCDLPVLGFDGLGLNLDGIKKAIFQDRKISTGSDILSLIPLQFRREAQIFVHRRSQYNETLGCKL